MPNPVSFYAHPESVFVPGLRPPSRDRRAVIEAVEHGDGPYVTAVADRGQATKKANGHDLEGMVDDLAKQAVKNNTRAYLDLPKPAEPEKTPRPVSEDIFKKVTGHFPRPDGE